MSPSKGARRGSIDTPTRPCLATITTNARQDDGELATHAALRSGGHLAFESRNPDDRAWERWNRETTYEQIDSPNGPMECWLELVGVGNGRVRFEGHNVFTTTDEDVIVSSELRFRSLAELTDSLTNSGFTVEHVFGDWERGAFVRTSGVMVFVARRD